MAIKKSFAEFSQNIFYSLENLSFKNLLSSVIWFLAFLPFLGIFFDFSFWAKFSLCNTSLLTVLIVCLLGGRPRFLTTVNSFFSNFVLFVLLSRLSSSKISFFSILKSNSLTFDLDDDKLSRSGNIFLFKFFKKYGQYFSLKN